MRLAAFLALMMLASIAATAQEAPEGSLASETPAIDRSERVPDGSPPLVSEPGLLDFLERFQSGLGALLGLLALSGVALYNARAALKRDDRLRKQDGRAVAAELVGEFDALQNILSAVATAVDANPARSLAKPLIAIKGWRPKLEVYRANYGRIGLLGPRTAADIANIAQQVDAAWAQYEIGFVEAKDVEEWTGSVHVLSDRAGRLAGHLAEIVGEEIERHSLTDAGGARSAQEVSVSNSHGVSQSAEGSTTE